VIGIELMSVSIIPASDASLLVAFGNDISLELHRCVLSLFRTLQAQADPRIRNLHPAYASLLVDFDPLLLGHEELAAHLERMLGVLLSDTEATRDIVEIPVCYGGEFGPDLVEVAAYHKLSEEEVIRLHSTGTYLVYFLGFSPGFAYLGGLPKELHTSRLSTPRKFVPAGTLGIAGSQTGVYPVSSAGGWRLIGRTPLSMFNPDALSPARLQPGDAVKFVPIDRATFDRLKT
jgi:KipI family sensor histidine kinase inhibitor